MAAGAVWRMASAGSASAPPYGAWGDHTRVRSLIAVVACLMAPTGGLAPPAPNR